MKKVFGLVVSILLGLFLTACVSTQKTDQQKKQPVVQELSMESIKGYIFYRERIALLPNAMVQIMLEDVSIADVPATVLSQQTFITNGDQVPLDFELSYDINKVKPHHRYSVRAQIQVEGKLIFTTDTIYPVITDRKATKKVNLLLIGVQ